MKREFLISVMLATAGTLAACQTSPADRPPGTYESESTRIDSSGTKYKTKTVSEVEYDKYGNKKATVETETSKDPRGLFNKTETKTTETYRE